MKYAKAYPLLIIILFQLLILTSTACKAETTNLIVDLPLYDAPYNRDLNLRDPSMTQALQFSKAFYQLSHLSINAFWGDNTDATLISIILFDTLATWLPLSNGWLHEEWHRAVMGQYNIDSRNDIYDLEFFEETISVSHVRDEDLAYLKEHHPADLIRLHSAGLESQNQLNLAVETDQFVANTQIFDGFLLWVNSINTTAYLHTCSTGESTRVTNKILSRENTSIADRDFTGLDCNAWVYDLFRPDEIYADRGTHPSGSGINRYITYDRLTNTEQNFLRKQYYLSFLNFIDPFLINKRFFDYSSADGERILWNANIKHYLTPFGYSINLHGYMKSSKKNLLFTLGNQFNKNYYFPAIGVKLIDFPIRLFSNKVAITAGTKIWQQPRQFSFTSSRSSTGASFSTRVDFKITRQFGSYLSVSHKTSGWLEGNVYLNSNSNIVFGITYRA